MDKIEAVKGIIERWDKGIGLFTNPYNPLLDDLAKAIIEAGYVHKSEVFCTVDQIEEAGYVLKSSISICYKEEK